MLRYLSIGLAVWLAMEFMGAFKRARANVAAVNAAAGRGSGRLWATELMLIVALTAFWPGVVAAFMVMMALPMRPK